MPTRYLKESICTSDSLSKLSAEGERFWYRLIVQCDDFGRMDARPQILRALCFSLMLDRISEADITTWLEELKRCELIRLYSAKGKPYLEIINFTDHNTPRAKVSKYPNPPSDDSQSSDLQTVADNCKQLHTDASSGRQILSESESESESNDRSRTPEIVEFETVFRLNLITAVSERDPRQKFMGGISFDASTRALLMQMLNSGPPLTGKAIDWALDQWETAKPQERFKAQDKGCVNWMLTAIYNSYKPGQKPNGKTFGAPSMFTSEQIAIADRKQAIYDDCLAEGITDDRIIKQRQREAGLPV